VRGIVAGDGSSRPDSMRPALAFGLIVACVLPRPVHAAELRSFNIPAQRLDTALIALGNQAQISIGGVDARMGTARSKVVRGKMSVARALQIMLHDTDFTFEDIDANTVRIIHAAPAREPRLKRPPPKPAPSRPLPDEPPPDIIVTATKQQQGLDRYAGTAHVEKVDGVGMSENLGTAAFVARIPALTSTNLGPGRNKLFVRGIADSSFSGPTQSTVGLYLGDLRLTYNAPEPDLRLYDIDRIEVIEGPQGTLYGAGTLGGIIRIMPNTPDASGFHASASAGRSLTKDGAPGFDLGGVINVPIVKDHVALRIVGYRQIEGGYIDNATLGTRHTNRSGITGGRASLRIQPGDHWTINFSAISQNIDTRDGQYAERDLAPRTHAANIAQPHDNDFNGASLEIDKTWDRLALVSSTGIVKHDLSETFDATGYLGQLGVQAFESSDAIRLITHETRLSQSGADGSSWVAGVSFVRNIDRIERTLGPIGAPAMLAALRNAKTEMAVFGEATQPISARWYATLGARFVYASTMGELLGGAGQDFEPRRKQKRILPTAALSWKPQPDIIAFLRYQSGFRSGGIAISGGGQINSAQRFESDEIHTAEIGMRFGDAADSEPAKFSGGITGFFSIWNSIQADLIGASGLPYTDNIGRGRVFGAEANLIWRATKHLTLDGAMFFNNSALVAPALGFEDANESSLPNIAKAGGRFSVLLERPLTETLKLRLDGTLRYVGASSLGTTPSLVLEQGETTQANLSATLDAGAWAITFDATNLTNSRRNSFSYGNPFTVAQGRQITPLRPRTVRLGLRVAF
jgi:iron complex outermembrane recepter protein